MSGCTFGPRPDHARLTLRTFNSCGSFLDFRPAQEPPDATGCLVIVGHQRSVMNEAFRFRLVLFSGQLEPSMNDAEIMRTEPRYSAQYVARQPGVRSEKPEQRRGQRNASQLDSAVRE
jgi:hypothetical protein